MEDCLWALILWALIGDIQRSYPNKITDPDTQVRDQFVEHVRDVALRRELKSIVRQDPSISFFSTQTGGYQMG